MTAMYVAPSFTSFGPKRAYASITGIPRCDSELCNGGRKAAKLTMQYTGLANAGSNSQGAGKVDVSGDPGGASPVYVEATDKDPSKHGADANEKFWFTGPVVVGGTFVIDSANGASTNLKATTYVYIYDNSTDLNLLQTIEFHTSCSQDLFLGDGFGTLLLTQFVDENGDIDCDAPVDLCAGNEAKVLTMMYTGAAASSHSQGSKVTVTDHNGGPGATDPVFIRSSNKDGPTDTSGKVWFEGVVALGGSFGIDATNEGVTKLTNDTRIHIFTSDGNTLLQSVKFHTSCSKPLRIDDQFGASKLTGFVAE